MFFLKKFNYLIFFALISSNLAFGEEILEEANILNKLYTDQASQLDHITQIFQIIGLQINKLKLNAEQKNEVKKWILDNQKFINDLSQNREEEFVQKIISLSQIINNLLINIQLAFESNFAKLSDTSTLINRNRIESDENLQITDDRIKKNSSNLKNISEQTSNIGLSKVNISFRKIEKFNQEHKLSTKLTHILIAGSAFSFVLYLTSEEKLPDYSILKKLKKFIGGKKPLDVAVTVTPKIDYEMTGVLGKGEKIVHILGQLGAENPVLIGIGLALFKEKITNTIKKTYNNAESFCKNQYKQIYNNLRGGYQSSSSTQAGEKAITLDDPKLVGLESQKEDLYEIMHYFENPAVYDRTKTSVNKGILLIGDSGCGKTLAAKALCGSINKMLREKGSNINVQFKEIKFSDIVWEGDCITKLIEEEQKKGPTILVFDELHLHNLQTESWGATLHAFLTGMSGLSSSNDNGKHPIILVGATNKPDLLDPALLRPGRFGTIIRFEKPDFQTRKDYFQVMFDEYTINTENIDLDILARHTQNCSYAQLEKIVSSARIKARIKAKGVSSTKDLLDVIDKHIKRIKPEIFHLSETEKNIVGAHIAGQAMARILLEPHTKLLEATIKGILPKVKERYKYSDKSKQDSSKPQQIKYGKIFKLKSSEFIDNADAEDQLKECKIYLAGHIAQKLLLNKAYDFKKSDKRKAFLLMQKFINDGLRTEDLTKEAARINEQKAMEMLKQFETEIEKLLLDNITSLNKINEQLKANLTLNEKELTELLKS